MNHLEAQVICWLFAVAMKQSLRWLIRAARIISRRRLKQYRRRIEALPILLSAQVAATSWHYNAAFNSSCLSIYSGNAIYQLHEEVNCSEHSWKVYCSTPSSGVFRLLRHVTFTHSSRVAPSDAKITKVDGKFSLSLSGAICAFSNVFSGLNCIGLKVQLAYRLKSDFQMDQSEARPKSSMQVETSAAKRSLPKRDIWSSRSPRQRKC